MCKDVEFLINYGQILGGTKPNSSELDTTGLMWHWFVTVICYYGEYQIRYKHNMLSYLSQE